MTKLDKLIIASIIAFAIGFFDKMAKTIIELDHRVSVLEDQMEQGCNCCGQPHNFSEIK